jgi:nicotinamide phosphoribosyltransferase
MTNKTFVKVVAGDRDVVMHDPYGYFTDVKENGKIAVTAHGGTFIASVKDIGDSLQIISEAEYNGKKVNQPKYDFRKNLILNTDSYKVSMAKQYPVGTTGVYSYIASRGGKFDFTQFFGLQMFIKEYMLHPITKADIDIAEEILTAHGEPFDRSRWDYILETHNGWLPVKIKAVAEGTNVPVGNALVTIENTDPKCYWLTTWLETPLLRAVWYPTTVSTQSKYIKNILMNYLEKSGDPTTIGFKLHDFGARGVSSMESAGIGGAAHLVNFMGTDTITGVLYAREYYNAGIAGFSIPAAEHSTITSWGRKGELDAYSNMVTQFGKPGAIVAVVSDSYNIYEACKMWSTGDLKQQVIDSGATVVIRPDSGDPVEVMPKMIQILSEGFGYTVNSKGYKVLNNVRMIWGDGINPLSIQAILRTMVDFLGWSIDNFAFGMGGALLQAVDRDTQKWAMKCSSALVNGEWVEVFKDPITDSGKASLKGRVTLWESGGEFETSVNKPTRWTDKGIEWTEVLKTVYLNGTLRQDFTFEEVRANSMK